mgnify:FL=1
MSKYNFQTLKNCTLELREVLEYMYLATRNEMKQQLIFEILKNISDVERGIDILEKQDEAASN